jgi:hypothetical protein
MSDPKIIEFPLSRNRRNAPSNSDALLAAEIGKAWRKLWRTIRSAQSAGLIVATEFEQRDTPKISRHF